MEAKTIVVNGVRRPMTEEEAQRHEAEQAERQLDVSALLANEATRLAKFEGIEIEGVMCSATKEDQTGLVAVERFFNLSRSAGVTPAPTVFRFANGNTLEITDVNFDAIYAAWVSFRQSFFVERS